MLSSVSSRSLTLERLNGTLSVVGSDIDAVVISTLAGTLSISKYRHYSLTVVSSEELAQLSLKQVALAIDSFSSPLFHVAGIGCNPQKTRFHITVICAALQILRKSLSLPATDLYIPLTDSDDGDIPRGIESIPADTFSMPTDPDFLDQLALTSYLLHRHEQALEISAQLALAEPSSHKGFIRIADAAFQLGKFKLAMLAYASAIHRTNTLAPDTTSKVCDYGLKKLVECSKCTEWGCVMTEQEIKQIPPKLFSSLLAPWSQDLRVSIGACNVTPELCFESRMRLSIPRASPTNPKATFFQLPRFFRWLVPFEVAIMSTPRNADDVAVLASQELGIRTVLTLTEEEPLPKSWFLKVRHRKIVNIHSPIPNRHPPTLAQMDLILSLIADPSNRPILIHCGAGKGRAGTVAACYLAGYGFHTPETVSSQEEPCMSSQEAISSLRSLRPGSLETKEQERFVSQWVSTVWKRRSILAPREIEEPPPSPFQLLEGTLDPESDNLFILVGLPGSGKSEFSAALKARCPHRWKIISQDDSGSRALCETEIGVDPNKARRIGKQQVRVVLDRCNTSSTSRRDWHALASNWVRRTVCVWFDYPEQLCITRAQSRLRHPTLPPGPRVLAATKQFVREFDRPSIEREPYLSAVIRVASFAAAEELVRHISPPVGLFKYPRTPHLIDLGAAADDDIVVRSIRPSSHLTHPGTPTTTTTTSHIVITEKTDGANLGFSLSLNRQLLVQNRAHYINSSTHAQFKHLNRWIDEHRAELYSILDQDPYFPERFVLFGEWVYAMHSIHYQRLPDLFLAFDLYDRSTESWADRSTLLALLADTTIHPVRAIYEGQTLPSDETLIQMTQGRSHFYDGKVEGIYVYFERGGQVIDRGKVVRGDFISGNEHWTRGRLKANGLERSPTTTL